MSKRSNSLCFILYLGLIYILSYYAFDAQYIYPYFMLPKVVYTVVNAMIVLGQQYIIH